MESKINSDHNFLKEKFIQLLKPYQVSNFLVEELWNEIEQSHSAKNRHYHSLDHLSNLYTQLNKVKDKIQNWESILFCMFYHDIIYSALKSDNELKSAELAKSRMNQIAVKDLSTEECYKHILATKSHTESENSDTNYFTDADLSILAAPWESYLKYCKNVRKEYAIYPDLIYNNGRKKVIKHFLQMEKIYKTGFFNNEFETRAKENLERELQLLK